MTQELCPGNGSLIQKQRTPSMIMPLYAFKARHVVQHFAALLIMALLSIGSANLASAAPGRDDYDIDDDGLLEIEDVQDFLAMGNYVSTLYGQTTGCAEAGCKGFELTRNLDFAEQDVLSTDVRPSLYLQVFDGNGFSLNNLTLESVEGVFNQVIGSTVQNVAFNNLNISRIDWDPLGGVAGIAQRSLFKNVRVTGEIHGRAYTGGLVALASDITLVDCHFEGLISLYPTFGTEVGIGGLVSRGRAIIYASSAKGRFELDPAGEFTYDFGGLIGLPEAGTQIIASTADMRNAYSTLWGSLTTTFEPIFISSSYSIERDTNGEVVQSSVIDNAYVKTYSAGASSRVHSVSLDGLSCPTKEFDPSCHVPSLFDNWLSHRDSLGQTVWRLGSEEEIPSINPLLVFDSADSDGDTVPDFLDDFPNSPAAAQDIDGDSLPDNWLNGCDEQCRLDSGLELDNTITWPEPSVGTSAGATDTAKLLFMLLCLSIYQYYGKYRRRQ